jgi:hypothetical protein
MTLQVATANYAEDYDGNAVFVSFVNGVNPIKW